MAKYIVYSLFFLFFFSFALNAQSDSAKAYEEINRETQKFRTLLEKAYKSYPDSISIKKMSEAAFSAMLQSLDAYSNYFTPEQYKQIKNSNAGSTVSIGVGILSFNDTLTIVSVTSGGSADSVGIRTGDRILFINGENAVKLSINDGLNKLTGTAGTKVNLMVKRGKQGILYEFNPLRKEIPLVSITSSNMLTKDIGYIKLERFSMASGREFEETAAKLKKAGMKKMILDLRGNLGGFLDPAVEIADALIPGGKMLTYIKGKEAKYYKEFISKDGGTCEKIPVIVIIDEQSASASEVIAGAMQDLDRGLVVGSFSFGKGSVQELWEFTDGSAFRFTVSKYFTPLGRCIQKMAGSPMLSTIPAALSKNIDENAQSMILKIMAQTGGNTQMPVYKTAKGRMIIGGGCIFPDYLVKEDTLTLLTNYLKTNGFILDFSMRYLDSQRDNIIEIYKDYNAFCSNFVIDEDLLSQLINYSRERNIWNEQMYQIDKEYIRNLLKANIAYLLWGDEAYYPVMQKFDKAVKKAVEVFPKAETLIN